MSAQVVDWPGRTFFGKWKVEEVIGVGGTSTVLRARHRNGRRAALKILHLHLATHTRTRERFLREGRLANLVHHPGVVAVLDDFVTEDGAAVLVLELVQGENLLARAKSFGGVLSPREVVEAASAVLDILAVAHDAGVIHRDIKPENVLYRSDGGYKLADFGLAGLGHELGMLTGTGVALGTPAYMSPEQARADTHDIDARTDVWGVGASMFKLLTGRYLHADSAAKNLVVAAATLAVPPVSSLEPLIPAELAEIIDRAVRTDKAERWPDARSMLSALSALRLTDADVPLRVAVVGDAGTATVPSGLTSWSRPGSWLKRVDHRARRVSRGAVVALALAAAVLAISASVLLRSRAAGAGAADPEAKLGASSAPEALRNARSTEPIPTESGTGESALLATKSVASQTATPEPRARHPATPARRAVATVPGPSSVPSASPAPSASTAAPAPVPVDSANRAIEPRSLYRR